MAGLALCARLRSLQPTSRQFASSLHVAVWSSLHRHTAVGRFAICWEGSFRLRCPGRPGSLPTAFSRSCCRKIVAVVTAAAVVVVVVALALLFLRLLRPVTLTTGHFILVLFGGGVADSVFSTGVCAYTNRCQRRCTCLLNQPAQCTWSLY